MLELRIKDETLTQALLRACADNSSEGCQSERKKAYYEMATYQRLSYDYPKENQAGYQEIDNLLKSLSPEGYLMRQIYDGYKEGYRSLGYSEESAGIMAGRTISVQMIANGVSGTIGWSALNKLFANRNLVSANKGTTGDSAISELTGITQKQLDKKFKHAEDFGVITTKKNADTLSQYETAIKNHMGDTATKSKGTYGFVDDFKVFFNSKTNNVVVLDKSGNFVTGFKLTPDTSQYENYIKNGVLR